MLSSNEKVTFRQQLNSFDVAMQFLSKEKKTLDQSPPNEQIGSENDLQNKNEYITGCMACFKGVKKMFLLRDAGMDEEYEDLSCGPEKNALRAEYRVMTQYLNRIEINIYKILGLENSWFSQQIYEVQKWIAANPKTAIAMTGISAGVLAGALGILTEWGIHVVHILSWGFVPAMGVAANVAVGLFCGFVLGFVLVGFCNWAMTGGTYRTVTEDAARKAREIQSMMEAIREMPGPEFTHQVEQLMGLHETMESTIPSYEDRQCNWCLSEGSEVKIPVKVATCGGQHFMCKTHFQEWYESPQRGGDLRCTVCRT
jgi:hypothetical protein